MNFETDISYADSFSSSGSKVKVTVIPQSSRLLHENVAFSLKNNSYTGKTSQTKATVGEKQT